MPLHVTIYNIKGGKNNVVGTITLHQRGLTTNPKPGGEGLLRKIMREPIQDPTTRHTVNATSNPEAWMRALQYHFRSPYLRASAPSPTETPPPMQPAINPFEPSPDDGAAQRSPDDVSPRPTQSSGQI